MTHYIKTVEKANKLIGAYINGLYQLSDDEKIKFANQILKRAIKEIENE